MPGFNPDTGLNPDGQPMLDYMRRPAQEDKSMQTLFSGLGEAVSQAGQVVDTQVQSDIKTDAQSALDSANKQFGYTTADVPNTAGSPTNTPPELSGTAAKLGQLAAAKAQGKLTDSHYWALLTTNVKDLKAKYPGYSDQVDSIVQQTTGGVPANQLRSALDSYNQSLASNAQDDAKKIESQLFQDAGIIGQYVPNFNPTDPQWKDPSKYGPLLSMVSNFKAKQTGWNTQEQLYKLKSASTSDDREQAGQIYQQQASNLANTAFKGLGQSLGLDGTAGQDTQTVINAALNTPNPDPQKVNLIQQGIKAQILKIQSQYADMHTSAVATKGNLQPAQMEAAEKQALAPFLTIQDMINNKDYGAAAAYTNATNMLIARNENLAVVNSKKAAALMTISKINPGLGQVYGTMNNNALLDEFTKSLDTGLIPSVAVGQTKIDEMNAILTHDQSVTDKQRSTSVTYATKKTAAVLADPKTPDSIVRSSAEQIFKNGAVEGTFSDLADEYKGHFLNTIVTPAVTDRIAKLNDPELTKSLAKFAFNKAQATPEMRQVAGQIGETGNSDAQFIYNPNTYQFQVKAPDSAEMGQAHDMQVITQNKISGFNRTLANLAYTMKAAGIDPNDANNPGSIPSFLKILGAQGSSGTLNQLQKAWAAHADTTPGEPAKPTPEPTKGPDFSFISHPGVAASVQSSVNGANTLRDLIGSVEGGPSGYNSTFNDGGKPRANLTGMTMDEVRSYMHDQKIASVGKSQFIPTTFLYAMREAGLKGGDLFSPENQDKMTDVLIKDAGLEDFKKGKIDAKEFQRRLSGTWAALPNPDTGHSNYERQGGHASNAAGQRLQQLLAQS